MKFLNIDEFDSDEEKDKGLSSFNLELFQMLNLDNNDTKQDKEDKEIEDAIDKAMAYVSGVNDRFVSLRATF